MPYTNKTPNYMFPQWLATDYPSFVKDMNPAYLKIDTTLNNLSNQISEINESAQEAANAAKEAKKAALAAQTAADNAVQLLVALGVTNESEAQNFKEKVDNAVPKYNILASYFDTI